MKVHILPRFRGEDKGDGGIRRVVEAQHKYLPNFGIEVVNNADDADLLAVHAGSWIRDFDKPVVHHTHGLYWNEYDWPRWAQDLNGHVVDAIRKADVTTAPSEWVAQILRRAFWINAVPLIHGVDSKEWTPPKSGNDTYVLWNKTRVDPVCDVEPMQQLARLAQDVQFLSTIGDVTSNVTIVGVQPYERAKRFVQEAGVYLCTTRETFGIGTLEAMACGVPILGWNWGGQREIVTHTVDGWLARPGDYEGLLEGLRYCIENRKRLSKAARASAQKFTWESAIERYATLYDEVLYNRVQGPKVSVVIPCYNLVQYLPDAVNSVMQQTMQDFEIIIVDDASPDNTLEVATKFVQADSRICVIHNEKNLYLAGALNAGFAQARGKYLIPLDADNMLPPDALRVLSMALDNNEDIDVAYGRAKFVLPDGITPDSSVAPDGISNWPRDFNFEHQMRHWNQCPSTSMYRKNVWQRSGGYRRRCKTAEDGDFWTRISSLGFRPAKVTDAVTFIYRQRQDSMSRVNEDWDWTAWFPWSRLPHLTPPGVKPANISTYEPPLISVVIPVGPGHEHYVIDAVDSLVAQTFHKWEVIVVNDTGGSIPWIHPFARVVDTSSDSDYTNRVSHARNKGVSAASAALFLLLDADDYLQPSALEDMYETYKQYRGYIYTDWMVQETKEVHLVTEFNPLQTMPHAVTGLYEKAQWKRIGGFDESLSGWEDWDFIIALHVHGYCGTRVSKPLLQYRMQLGTVRENNYARQEELKAAIYTKWAKYITGETERMACGGCGQAQQAYVQQQTQSQSVLSMSDDDMVLLEFTKEGSAAVTYRGAVTGAIYRFGSDKDHRVRYVNKNDAEQLLLRPEFQQYERGVVLA